MENIKMKSITKPGTLFEFIYLGKKEYLLYLKTEKMDENDWNWGPYLHFFLTKKGKIESFYLDEADPIKFNYLKKISIRELSK